MAKSIKIKWELKGRGGINYDDSSQKYFLNEHCGTHYKGDNIQLLKKVFQELPNKIEESYVEENVDENGNITSSKKTKTIDIKSTVKISSNCLRSGIFGENCPNALALYSDSIFLNFITSPDIFVRGYMETVKDGTMFNRKSALSLTDAIETSGAVPYLEVCSRNVKKEKDSNSLFYRENIGDAKYEVKGNIDFKTLQFLSDDELFGRMSFKSEWLEGKHPLMECAFLNHYKRIPYKVGYFTSTKGILTDRWAEHGIKFDDDFIKFMIKKTLKKILNFEMWKTKGFVATDSLKIKLVDNGIKDSFDNEDGWVELTEEIIDNFDFNINDFYDEADIETVTRTRKELEENRKNSKEKKEAKKQTKKSNNNEEVSVS